MEERVLNISRKKTEYLGCNEHQDADILFTGRDSKESEDIHIPGIYVGGGWRTGLRKSPTECRVAGRTGRECLECFVTG